MSTIFWPVAVYFGIGLVWLSVVLVMARSQYEYVSPKESAVHILGWPFVLIEVKLWWVATAAVALVGLTAFAVVDRSDRWPSTASSTKARSIADSPMAKSISTVPQPVHPGAL